jgi:hypothetical protein
MDTYQCQPIGIRVPLDMLGNVPVRHPRTHDVKRKLRPRNIDDGEYVRMGKMPAFVDITREALYVH